MAVLTNTAAKATGRTVPRRRDYLPYLLALPIILYEGFFILIPIIQQFGSSFTSDVIGMGPAKWIGLDNYNRMIADSRFWNSVRVTFSFMVATVIFAVVAGVIVSRFMHMTFL